MGNQSSCASSTERCVTSGWSESPLAGYYSASGLALRAAVGNGSGVQRGRSVRVSRHANRLQCVQCAIQGGSGGENRDDQS
jgi:hypothetical protein